MEKIKPYTKYKKVDVSWLGDIPNNWSVNKVKHVFTVQRGRVIANTDLIDNGLYPVYSSQTKNNGRLGYINSFDYDGEYISWTTDGVYAGTTFVRKGKFNATNICGLLKLKINYNIEYFGYLFSHIIPFNKRPDTNGAKIMSNEMKDIIFIIPSLPEQTAIANFLDYKTAKIDRFIRKKKQLIKLLNEQKAGIINNAVTKGLNPKAKMKPSGIEWLGDIPAHWEVKKLKYVAKICNGKDCDKKPEGTYPVYGSGGIFGWNEEFIYDKPSVLLGRKGTIDKPILVTEPFWTVDTAFYTKIKTEVIEVLFFYYLCTNIPYGYYGSKTALPSMTQTSLYEVYFPIPSISEQKQIVSYIEKETAILNKTIETIEKEIALTQEYRTSLIAEAVTGKIDVRNYKVPEIVEEEELTDDTDDEVLEETINDDEL